MAELSPIMKTAFEEHSRWPLPIPVSERLPDLGEFVLVFMFDPIDGCSGWDGGCRMRKGLVADSQEWVWDHRWDDGPGCAVQITHWLPMPPKPQCQSL